MQRFLKLGLPSQHDETWRYTDLRSLAAQTYAEAGCAVAKNGAAAAAAEPQPQMQARAAQCLVVLGECRAARGNAHDGQWLPAIECRFADNKWN